MVQLEIVVDVVGTVGEGTEVAMVGMLAPGLALTLLCPELAVTCPLGDTCGVVVVCTPGDVTTPEGGVGIVSFHLCKPCLFCSVLC